MSSGSEEYKIPPYLKARNITQDNFINWLERVTSAHLKRDRRRFEKIGIPKAEIKRVVYRKAIYKAVEVDGAFDFYTGEILDWTLLHLFQDFNHAVAKDDKFVPSVDHEEQFDPRKPNFKICSLRTNKCKSNYSIEMLKEFCQSFLAHQNKS